MTRVRHRPVHPGRNRRPASRFVLVPREPMQADDVISAAEDFARWLRSKSARQRVAIVDGFDVIEVR